MLRSLGPGVRALLLACIALFALEPLRPEVLDTLALWPLDAGFQPWKP